MKRLGNADYNAVTSILESNGLIATDIGPEDMETFVGVMEGTTLVAVGSLQTYGTDGLLRSVATDPRFRKRGYAHSIVEELETAAAQEGIRAIYLLTDSATAFFERSGYRVELRSKAPSAIATTEQFTTLCPDTATFMVKNLASDHDSDHVERVLQLQ